MPICEKCDEHAPRLFPLYDDRGIIELRVCFNCYKEHHKEKAKEKVKENEDYN